MAHEYCSTTARALTLMLAPGTGAGIGARRALVAELAAAGREALADPAARLTDRQRGRLEGLQLHGATLASELGTEGLRRLEGRGLVRIEPRVRPRRPVARPLGSAAVHAPRRPTISGARWRRCTARSRVTAPGESLGFLLHGVTGSGKTEVYLHAVQDVPGGGTLGDRAGPRDRAHAAGPVAISGAVRGCRRGPSLGARARRAPRRMAASAKRRGARLRRSALGRVRAGEQSRPGHRRRGARWQLQTRGRPALRRPSGRRDARRAVRRPAGGRQRHPAARERARDDQVEPRAARRPPADAGRRGARHA